MAIPSHITPKSGKRVCGFEICRGWNRQKNPGRIRVIWDGYEIKAVVLLEVPGKPWSAEDGFYSLRMFFLSFPNLHPSYFSICGVFCPKTLSLLRR